MSIEDVINLLNLIVPQQEACNEYLLHAIRYKKVAKNEYLLKAGSISNELCFIISGKFRCFYQVRTREVTTWIMQPGGMIMSVSSYIHQKASYEDIQALEDGEVYFLHKKDLDYIYKHFIEFNIIRAIMHEQHRAAKDDHLFHIWGRTPYEKVKYVVTNFPNFLQEVAAKHIASMLGITEVSFSRAKKKLMNELGKEEAGR